MKRTLAILIMLVLPLGVRADITSNLQAWWKLDDGSGGTAADSSGNARTLTLNTPPTWQAGHIGSGSLLFTAASLQYCSASSIAPIEGTVARSFGFWFKSSSSGSNQYLFSYGDSSAAGKSFRVGLESGVMWFRGASCTRSWGTGYADNTWRHAVISIQASGLVENVTLYINGSSVSPSATTGTGTAINTTGSTTFYVGYDFAGSGFWNGSIDDFRAYSRQLSGADVTELYNYTGATTVIRRGRLVNSGATVQKQSKSSLVNQ